MTRSTGHTGARIVRLATMLATLLGAAMAAPAGAQVGFEPEESPYRDIYSRHEVTGFGGWFQAKRDPAGVAPQGGPMGGVRYEFYAGGPAWLVARLGAAQTERRVIDPTVPLDQRVEFRETGPLLLGDLGVALSLTGRRTWHNLIPVLAGGVGVASNLRGGTDLGGFGFGTRFALTAGAGVRWLPSERLQLRFDATDHLYRINYPDSYYLRSDDGPAVLPPTQPRSLWTHNVALTIGVGYLIGR